MKSLPLICFLLICFLGCKKSDVTLSPIEVQVSMLTGRLVITAIDVTQNNSGILNAMTDDGAILSTAIVYPGDQINITYSSPFPPSKLGDDEATITYFYRGKKIGATSGSLGYPNNLSFTVTVPAQ